MPTVPDYGGLKVAASTGPDTQFSAPNVNPGQIAADQTRQLGDATMRLGVAGADIATDQFDLANQVKVNDAMNQARGAAQALTYDPQTGYANLKGNDALTRPSGQALPDEYAGKLKDALSNIAGGLTTDAQRRAFQVQSGNLTTQFQGDVERHMLGEFREYALSTQDGTINLASDTAKRAWSNPDSIGPAIDSAKAAVYQKGKLLGWAPTQIDAALLATTSKVHTDVVMSALENNNPTYALGYLDQNKKSMTADDILRVQGQVNQSVWANAALGAVSKATSDLRPTIAPTGFDRMQQITATSESGNKDFNPDGSVVTSSTGAQGRMQVEPGTAANPGFGIKPADLTGTPQQQADERTRVGTQYLQALVQKYGDPAKAWAAYNAGPQNVDKAIADSAKSPDDPTNPLDWLNKLAKYQSGDNHIQTVTYVDANMKALGSTGNIAPRPTESDFVTAALGNLPPGAAPQLVMKTREQAVQQFTMINKSLNEQGENAVAAAQRWIMSSPGVDINQMPASLRDSVNQYAPGKYDDLVRYSRTLAKGDVVTNLGRYNDIVTNMPAYAAMTDSAWTMMQTQLAPPQFEQLSKERANYINGKSDTSPQALNTPAVNQALKTRMEALQLPTSAPPTDLTTRAAIGGTQQFVRNYLLSAQQHEGKKFTPAEIEDRMDRLFATDVGFKTSFLGIPTGSTAQPLMAMGYSDLPDGAADQIKQRLVNEGNRAPTQTDILNRYRLVKSSGQ